MKKTVKKIVAGAMAAVTFGLAALTSYADTATWTLRSENKEAVLTGSLDGKCYTPNNLVMEGKAKLNRKVTGIKITLEIYNDAYSRTPYTCSNENAGQSSLTCYSPELNAPLRAYATYDVLISMDCKHKYQYLSNTFYC